MTCQVCESRPAMWRIVTHAADGDIEGNVCEVCGTNMMAYADELTLVDIPGTIRDIPPVIQNCPQCYGAPIGECPFCGTRCTP
jgi:protein-arginine kinase activator protein McsA